MPSEEEAKPYLTTGTEELKLVSEYAALSFNDAVQLDCYTFKLLLRDAFIFKMRQKEEGKEYLENCWLLQQQTPDRDKLRKQFNK